jgi:hypothetical protein
MDYIAILGHNLSGATISVIHSTSTSYSTSGTTAGTALSTTVPSNSVFLREFAAPGASRFTRIQISGMTTAPRIDVLSLGTASTIAFIQPPFDPYGQNTKTNISMTEGGYIAGIHSKFTERRINLRFNGVTTSLYNIFNTWHENSGQKNFFMAWDSTGDSSAVYLVRPSERFMNPINVDQFRGVTINLKGRKE